MELNRYFSFFLSLLFLLSFHSFLVIVKIKSQQLKHEEKIEFDHEIGWRKQKLTVVHPTVNHQVD